MIMCHDIILFIFLVLGFVELLGSKVITTKCFLQRDILMSKTLIDEMKKFLNDGTKWLLNKDQLVPECFKIVLSFGRGSHKPPVTYKNLVAKQRKSLKHVF